jgi:hypothetical protein
MVSPLLVGWLLLIQGAPDPGPALEDRPIPMIPSTGVPGVHGPPDALGLSDSLEPPGPLGLTMRSLILPGWGQRTADRGYWWLYTGVDALAWGGVAYHQREGVRRRTAYRDLAWEVARTPVWGGPRRDGPWSYYEQMTRWAASGRFDLRPDAETLHPETDEETFNGMIWRLARDLHLPADADDVSAGDPAYEQALTYYRSRAVPPELQWDWQGQEESRSRFQNLIRASDQAFRAGTTFVGIALVNRFISGAEVWIAAHPGPLSAIPITLESRFAPGPDADEWQFRVRVRPRSPPSSWPRS